ncbi:zinc-dependent alcohol dehydrogenase [Tengunoibacter tsumagoiensis]|uniref:Alcohol dehydrogenase n=1 Tax=Tengunoibacter tsumagoiensis TaxID=2014871 RepID=A0A401ZWL0_9CHLR|nr:zinc-binding dehydrogenase [Tengunoibacter tsumagoiensis]GCE11301.1 alcohol dehydrogenase [Tengunoibacter tsumagoiensis]
MQAQAILFRRPDEVALDSVTIPEPGPGEVLVEIQYSCISPGTELRCLSGKQNGLDDWPFIPGYAASGLISTVGPETSLAVGTPVFCGGTEQVSGAARGWGGHVSHAILEESNVYPLPFNLSLLDSSLAKQAAIAYHGLRLSRPQPSETVAVVGLGLIGQLSARLHAMTGARVVCTDLSASRVELARSAGLEAYQLQGSLFETLHQVLPQGADIVVDATGHPAVLPQAIALASDLPWDDTLTPAPRYLIQGSYDNTFSIPYVQAFYKELSFLLPRDQQPRDIRIIIELLAREKLHVRDLISAVRDPEQAATTYSELKTPDSSLLTAAFHWS